MPMRRLTWLRTTLFMARWRVQTRSTRDPADPTQWSDAGLEPAMKAHIDARIDQCFRRDDDSIDPGRMDGLTRSLFVLRVDLTMRPTNPPDYPDDAIPEPVHHGRGALSNESSRFDSEKRIRTTDGWETEASAEPSEDDELPPLRTTLTRDATRTILARNTSPDVPFDRSINPYRGCEHGCIYCFARPTHAYLGLSPGLDFETKILFKPDAAKLLEAELASPKYRPDVVAMGTNTDPYQPVERELKITRQILRVLSDFNNPVGIVTKSHLVTRDIDILADMAKRNLAEVFLSVTTLDKELARAMEPRASAPHRRLDAIRALNDAGIPAGVMSATDDPGPERPRDGGDPRGGRRGRRDARGLHRPAPAARDQGAVRGVAASAPARPCRARAVADPPDAWRRALPVGVRRAHEGRGPDRRAFERPLRRGGEAARA